MALLTKLINASSTGILNKDSDIQALADSILNQGVITTSGLGDLEVTAGQVASGRCFIRVNRTNTTPEENWLLLVINQEDTAVTLSSNKKIYIEIPQDNINDSSLNTNPLGTGVAEIVVGTSWPTGNYIKLAETDGSGVITDLREFITIKAEIINQIGTGTWKVYYSDGDGLLQEIALGTATQVLQSNGTNLPPSFVDIGNIAGITGEIKIWTTGTPPTNWLICDGSAVSRTTYSDLFAIIGEDYGVGDGSTTFNIPDLKGKVVVGYNSVETEFDTLGKTGGAKTHTLITNEIPAHTHPLSYWGNGGGTSAGIYTVNGQAPETVKATGSTGGGQAHNNLQPYITLHYIIKI